MNNIKNNNKINVNNNIGLISKSLVGIAKQSQEFLSTPSDLADLSKIPDSLKKKKMIALVKKLTLLQDSLADEQHFLQSFNTFYKECESITNLAIFNKKKKLLKLINNQVKQVLRIKSKIAKINVQLIFDHNCASNKHNKLTAQELFNIITALENGQFIVDPSMTNLNKLIKNEQNYNVLLFNKEVLENIKSGAFDSNRGLNATPYYKKQKKLNEYLAKNKNDLENGLILHQQIVNASRESIHAKLVKRLDNAVRKTKINPEQMKKSSSSEYIIELQNVTKYYYNKWLATKVLKNVNLKIKPGEFVIILGPSGSGKTTLLNLISGMDSPTYGNIIVNKQNLLAKSDDQLTKFRKENIGYIFQQYGLLPNLTVRENVEIGWQLQSDVKKRNDIDSLLKTVCIYENADKFPFELSGGQQQRVAIARSLAKNPAIIFADEPTGAVDEPMAKQILQLFVDINKKFHTTIIMITHNHIFTDLATRVIKVNSGTIVSDKMNKNPKNVSQLQWSEQ